MATTSANQARRVRRELTQQRANNYQKMTTFAAVGADKLWKAAKYLSGGESPLGFPHYRNPAIQLLLDKRFALIGVLDYAYNVADKLDETAVYGL